MERRKESQASGVRDCTRPEGARSRSVLSVAQKDEGSGAYGGNSVGGIEHASDASAAMVTSAVPTAGVPRKCLVLGTVHFN